MTTRAIRRGALAAALALGAFRERAAADDAGYTIANKAATNEGLFAFDYGVPESPALTLAGLADAKVTPSTSLKPFVIALPGLFGSDTSATTAAPRTRTSAPR